MFVVIVALPQLAAASNKPALWSVRFHLGHTRHVLGYLEATVPHLRFLCQLPGPGGHLSEALTNGFYYGGEGGVVLDDEGGEGAVLVGVDMEVVLAGVRWGGQEVTGTVRYRSLEHRLNLMMRVNKWTKEAEEEEGSIGKEEPQRKAEEKQPAEGAKRKRPPVVVSISPGTQMTLASPSGV
jgi:hypothetical protein